MKSSYYQAFTVEREKSTHAEKKSTQKTTPAPLSTFIPERALILNIHPLSMPVWFCGLIYYSI